MRAVGSPTASLFMAAAFAAAGLCIEAEAWVDKIPKPEQYRSGLDTYFGQAQTLKLPSFTNVVVFKAVEKQANFTSFTDARDIGVPNGAVGFTAASNVVLLGWGNCNGRQDLKDIVSIPWRTGQITLRVRQAVGGPSKWLLQKCWRDGNVMYGKGIQTQAPVDLLPGDWRDINLITDRFNLRGFDADGLEIKIETEPGARFEIAEVRFSESYNGCYARSEFTVPAGKVWRAVANLAGGNNPEGRGAPICESAFYVNGQVLERNDLIEPIDLRPYLKPGRNCVAAYGYQSSEAAPSICLNGSVIMESGQVIPLRTGAEWQYSSQAPQGWNQPGFAAAGWQTGLPPGELPRAGNKLPGWTGYLELTQPGRKALVFRDDQPALMQIRIPAGLAARSPTVKYELARSDKYGHCAEASAGKLKTYAKQDDSLAYALDAGKLPAGIYTLALTLMGGSGEIIEERPIEPLMVIRRLNLKEVPCADVKDGLELEPEIAIDFTKPNAGRPSIEISMDSGKPVRLDQPLVVTRDGLTYRELTGKSTSSFMSYRVEFKHPGDFYLAEVEYPDNAERCVEVLVSKIIPGLWINSVIGVGAETGGKYFKTGRMQKLHFLFGAPEGPASLDVRNIQTGWPAAVRSAQIYHVKGDLVSAGSSANRFFGIDTERDYYENSFSRSFRPEFIQNQAHQQEFASLPYLQQMLIKLGALQEVCDKYAQYLRFCGQNTHVIGCYQYQINNTPYVPFYQARIAASVVPCIRSVLANTLDVNDLSFYAGLEYASAANVSSSATLAAVKRGAESVWMINNRGEQIQVCQNWNTPAFRRVFFRDIRDLDNTFGDLKNYGGVFNLLSHTFSVVAFPGWSDGGGDPLACSYDDVTFRLFAEKAGVKLGIDPQDPDRFAKRAGLIQTNPGYREKFLAWRNERLVDFVAETAALIRQNRKDLRLVNVIGIEDPAFFRKALASGRPFPEYMKDYGFDFARLGQIENVALVRWSVAWNILGQARSPDAPDLALGDQIPETWVMRENESYASMLNACPRRGVLCRTSWDEGELRAIEEGRSSDSKKEYSRVGKIVAGTDWLLDICRTRGSPQAGGYHAREALIQGLITADPEYLFTGFVDAAINAGHEGTIRQIMRLYTRLPPDRFRNELDTGLQSNLAIRSLSKDGQSWLYAANPGYWAVDGTIMLETDGKIYDLADGREVAGAGKVDLKIRLEPFGLAAWRIGSGQLKVRSYQSGKIGAAELAYMRDGIIGRVRALLADPKAKQTLSGQQRQFMRDLTGQAEALLNKGEYAAAWALLKTPSFWSAWKFYLEKAAPSAASAGATKAVVGAVTYDASLNAISVVDFTDDDLPATLAMVRQADRKGAWGKVTYDPGANTYRLDANLLIGAEQTMGTYFRIGSTGAAPETLVMRGSIWIRPPAASKQRQDGSYSIMNRLSIGDPNDPAVKGAVKFDVSGGNRYGICIGAVTNARGALQVCNSSIGVLQADGKGHWGNTFYRNPAKEAEGFYATGWNVSELCLVNARLSDFAGTLLRGVSTGRMKIYSRRDVATDLELIEPDPSYRIEDSTFEGCGELFCPITGINYARRCTFVNCDVVFTGTTRADECVFRNNRHNWKLSGEKLCRGMAFFDCDLQPQTQAWQALKNSRRAAGIAEYPPVKYYRSVIVKVADAGSKPVPDAMVTVSHAEFPDQVRRGAAQTDAEGLTGRDPDKNAIQVLEKLFTATDDPAQPKIQAFTYTVRAEKGKQVATATIDMTKPVPQPLTVTLK